MHPHVEWHHTGCGVCSEDGVAHSVTLRNYPHEAQWAEVLRCARMHLYFAPLLVPKALALLVHVTIGISEGHIIIVTAATMELIFTIEPFYQLHQISISSDFIFSGFQFLRFSLSSLFILSIFKFLWFPFSPLISFSTF